jgi:hypothetical protein
VPTSAVVTGSKKEGTRFGWRLAWYEGMRRLPRASRHIQEQKALRACP